MAAVHFPDTALQILLSVDMDYLLPAVRHRASGHFAGLAPHACAKYCSWLSQAARTLLLSKPRTEDERRSMAEPRQTMESVADCNVSLMRGGSGEPLLFLHGARGGGQWLPFMDALSKDFEVFVPEHPGFGKSDTPPWLDNVADLAYFYLDFIEKLGLRARSSGRHLSRRMDRRRARRSQSDFAGHAHARGSPPACTCKGVPKATCSCGPYPELARNLFYDQKYAEWMLLAVAQRRRAGHATQESAHDREARLAAALLQSSPRQMAASHHHSHADFVGRKRQADSCTICVRRFATPFLAPASKFSRTAAICRKLKNRQEFVGALTRFLQGARR